MIPELLHQNIDRAAEQRPDAMAFRFMEHELSFSEFAERSARLAGALVELGVRRGDRVAIYLNKSLETAVAVYGILRAGAAYVPIDPEASPDRVQRVLRQAGVQVAITAPNKWAVLQQLATSPDFPVRGIVGLPEGVLPGCTTIPWSGVDASGPFWHANSIADDLAYVMFTSGSTGEPKGIAHTHSSGMAYARMSAALYNLGPDDRMINHSALHFDMSTFEFLSGPLAQASVVIASEVHMRLPAEFTALLEIERITTLYAAPYALVQMLLKGAVEARDLSALRLVAFGGEPFAVKHLRALMQQLPQALFSNSYGPAEVNQCTYLHLSELPASDLPALSIGGLCPGVEGVVLDSKSDTPVDDGASGELAIRSASRMRGYWDNAALTSDATWCRPVCEGIEDKFHRTGDIVRRDADGTYAFLGRKDRQIKVRGHRVELDEVEAVLADHDAVETAAAFSVEDGTEIEAAVVLRDPSQTPDLLQHCARMLPRYATPRAVHTLSDIPFTATGKVDRRALAARFETGENDD